MSKETIKYIQQREIASLFADLTHCEAIFKSIANGAISYSSSYNFVRHMIRNVFPKFSMEHINQLRTLFVKYNIHICTDIIELRQVDFTLLAPGVGFTLFAMLKSPEKQILQRQLGIQYFWPLEVFQNDSKAVSRFADHIKFLADIGYDFNLIYENHDTPLDIIVGLSSVSLKSKNSLLTPNYSFLASHTIPFITISKYLKGLLGYGTKLLKPSTINNSFYKFYMIGQYKLMTEKNTTNFTRASLFIDSMTALFIDALKACDGLDLLLRRPVLEKYIWRWNVIKGTYQSLMHIALSNKLSALAEILIEAKANINITDSAGFTPLQLYLSDMCGYTSYSNPRSLFLKFMRYFVSNGGNVNLCVFNQQSGTSYTLLQSFCLGTEVHLPEDDIFNYKELFALFFQHGALPLGLTNIAPNKPKVQSALIKAMVKVIIDQGVLVSEINPTNRPILLLKHIESHLTKQLYKNLDRYLSNSKAMVWKIITLKKGTCSEILPLPQLNLPELFSLIILANSDWQKKFYSDKTAIDHIIIASDDSTEIKQAYHDMIERVFAQVFSKLKSIIGAKLDPVFYVAHAKKWQILNNITLSTSDSRLIIENNMSQRNTWHR